MIESLPDDLGGGPPGCRFRARLATDAGDLAAARRLRARSFRAASGAARAPAGDDTDAFDARCRHVLIEDRATGELVSCCRVLVMTDGQAITSGYSAQYYDLSALSTFPAPMLEVGRFCIRPGPADPDIARVAWGALTRLVERERIAMLFGCTSFRGTDPSRYLDTFAILHRRHLAPARWRPGMKAAEVIPLAATASGVSEPDPRRAARSMPRLLRSYLRMGGWVSDHAVVDPNLGTLHVFTGLEIRNIPPDRSASLHALAARLGEGSAPHRASHGGRV